MYAFLVRFGDCNTFCYSESIFGYPIVSKRLKKVRFDFFFHSICSPFATLANKGLKLRSSEHPFIGAFLEINKLSVAFE